MDRKAVSVAGLTAVALLVAVAAFGCANRGGAVQPAGRAPAVQSSQGDKATSTPTPNPTPTPLDAATTNPTVDPGAADDSLAGDLSDLERLLGGINGALSGSEAGPSGGE